MQRNPRRQCPGCLQAHHAAGMYCAACESGLQLQEILRAAAVIGAGLALAIVGWLVLG